jgi:hypothetical protein
VFRTTRTFHLVKIERNQLAAFLQSAVFLNTDHFRDPKVLQDHQTKTLPKYFHLRGTAHSLLALNGPGLFEYIGLSADPKALRFRRMNPMQ